MSALAQFPLLALGVFVVGTPHGGLDGRLARRWLAPRLGPGWALPFAAAYLALAAAVALVWWAAPVAALAGFLLLGALHFGEERMGLPARLAHGLVPIVLPAAFHPIAVGDVFAALSGEAARGLVPWLGGPLLLLWGAAAVAVLATRADGGRGELLVAALLMAALPPLAAFALYFALVHSPRALLAARERGERLGGLIRDALPWSVAAVALALAAFLLLRTRIAAEPAFLRATFIWLAALSVPHMALHALAGGGHIRAGSHSTERAIAAAMTASRSGPGGGA